MLSPSFPWIALERAGNHREVPVCGTHLHPGVLDALGDAQMSRQGSASVFSSSGSLAWKSGSGGGRKKYREKYTVAI